MSKLLTTPTRFQVGATYEQAVPDLNNNFESLSATFNGFTVTTQPVLGTIGTGTTIGPGATGSTSLPVYTNDATDVAIAIQAKISVYIDPPTRADGSVIYPIQNAQDYLYPTGKTVTGGKLKVLIGSYTSLSKPTQGDMDFFTYTDRGVTYVPCNMVTFCVRNVDSVDHYYAVSISGSVFSANTSQFR